MRVRKDRLRVIEVGFTPIYLHASFCMTRAFVVFSEKMGLKRPMGILQNQTSGLLQLILYKRHGKVVGDTLFFERLTQGVTEEAHAAQVSFLKKRLLLHMALDKRKKQAYNKFVSLF